EIALRRRDDGYEALDPDGRPPPAWPDLLEIDGCGRAPVVLAVDDEGELRAAWEPVADGSAVLALSGRAARFLAYALDGAGPPERIACRPVDRTEMLRQARRIGLDTASALQAAWPPAERRTGEPSAAVYRAWI